MLEKSEATNKPPSRLLPPLGICFTILCWGSAYVAARSLLLPSPSNGISLSPLLLAALRFSIASLFFVAPVLQALLQHRISWHDLLMMAWLGQLAFSLYYWLQYIGIQQTNASIASLLGVGLIPLFTTVLAPLFGQERFHFSLLLPLFLGFLGVAFVVFQAPFSFAVPSGFLLGVFCLILNTFSFALYSHLSKRWMQNIPPIVLTGGTMMSGAVGLLLLSLLDSASNHWSLVSRLDGGQWFALLFLAVGCSVMAYLVYNIVLTTTEASRVALSFYLEPLVSIVVAAIVLGERLSWHVVVGALMIGGAVLLVLRRSRKE